MAVVVGKHLRTVQRYLSNDEDADKEPVESTTCVVLLKQAASKLKQWQQFVSESAAEKELMDRLPEVIGLIEKILQEKSEKNQ